MKVKKVIAKKEFVRFNTGVCRGKQELMKKIEKKLCGLPETAIFQNVYVGCIAILERKTVGKEIDLKYSKLFRYEDLVPGIMTAGQFKRLKDRGVIRAYTQPGPNTPGQYFINLPNQNEIGANRVCQSAEPSSPHYRQKNAQKHYLRDSLNRVVLDVLSQIVQGDLEDRQHPSRPATENTVDPVFLSQEKRADFYHKKTKARAQTPISDICETKQCLYHLYQYVAEALQTDCGKR